MRDNHITEIKFKTNGFEISDYSLLDLESELVGALMDHELIFKKVTLIAKSLQSEWTECIYRVKELQMQQTGDGSLARDN